MADSISRPTGSQIQPRYGDFSSIWNKISDPDALWPLPWTFSGGKEMGYGDWLNLI